MHFVVFWVFLKILFLMFLVLAIFLFLEPIDLRSLHIMDEPMDRHMGGHFTNFTEFRLKKCQSIAAIVYMMVMNCLGIRFRGCYRQFVVTTILFGDTPSVLRYKHLLGGGQH